MSFTHRLGLGFWGLGPKYLLYLVSTRIVVTLIVGFRSMLGSWVVVILRVKGYKCVTLFVCRYVSLCDDYVCVVPT